MVSGYFDPLIAETAERLAGLKREGRPLLVLVRASEDAILPARARGELIAGLRAVDHVCDAPSNLVPQIQLEAEHADSRARLIARVHARQQAK